MSFEKFAHEWVVDEFSVKESQADTLIGNRLGEVASVKAYSDELDVQVLFLAEVEKERNRLQGRDLAGSVINSDSVLIRDNKHEQMALYDELRTRGFGKVVAVYDQNNRLHWFRVAQANWTIKCGGEYIVNRLAPLARVLVSARVGDELDLPKLGEVEVVATRLLGGWQHTESDISKCEALDEAIGEKSVTLSGGRRFVSQWKNNLPMLLDHSSDAIKVREVDLGDGYDISDYQSLTDHDIDLATEQSLAADFYTRTTKEQEELIQRPNRGAIAVLGVAGSGKTAVGLGRLKALHDAQYSSEDSDEFDDFFNDQARMRAFVLSPQLKSYLKKTLDELHLSRLPISDFEEFRKQLIGHHSGLLAIKMPGIKLEKAKFGISKVDIAENCYSYEWIRVLDDALIDGVWEDINKNLDWFLGKAVGVINESRKVSGIAFDYDSAILYWIEQTRNSLSGLIKRESKHFRCNQLGYQLEQVLRESLACVQANSVWYFHKELGKWLPSRARNDINPIQLKPWSSEGYGPKASERVTKVRQRLAERMRRSLLLISNEFKGVPYYIERGLALADGGTSFKSEIHEFKQRLDNLRLSYSDVDAMLVLCEAMCSAPRKSTEDRVDLYNPMSRFSAVFIDEVQDFSEIQVLLMSMMADPVRNCVTVVGDFCQQLSQQRIKNFNRCFPGNSGNVEPYTLIENLRQPTNLANYSLYIRSRIDSRLVDVPPFVKTEGELSHIKLTSEDWLSWLADKLDDIPASKSIAIIFPDADFAHNAYRQFDSENLSLRESQLSSDGRDLTRRYVVHFTTPLPVKGLEFDVVIVPHFDKFDLCSPVSANAAYVAVSRPREELVLVDID